MDPRALYQIEPSAWAAVRGTGAPLLHLLDGFVDAGRVQRGVTDFFLGGDIERLATFDHDQLHDYRSRRPLMLFDTYRWIDVHESFLHLDKLTDRTGRPFLLLHGSEPDLQWERFTAALLGIADDLVIGRMYTMAGIPMAVPHTRPTGLTRHSTDEGLVHHNPPLIERVQIPGSLSALLEFRAGKAGRVAMGYAAHVPHYLAQVPFPQAMVAVLQALMDDTGLVLDISELVREVDESINMVSHEIEANPETQDVVVALEEAFDATRENMASVPTADEIGAEFERFLAERDPDADT